MLRLPFLHRVALAVVIGAALHGVALAQPRRRVFALEGDGSILMFLGCLATIAERKPDAKDFPEAPPEALVPGRGDALMGEAAVEEGIAGTPHLYFAFDREVRAARAYCDVGEALLEVYPAIVRKRMQEAWTEEERAQQSENTSFSTGNRLSVLGTLRGRQSSREFADW